MENKADAIFFLKMLSKEEKKLGYCKDLENYIKKQ